jgi:hypothetical protein
VITGLPLLCFALRRRGSFNPGDADLNSMIGITVTATNAEGE